MLFNSLIFLKFFFIFIIFLTLFSKHWKFIVIIFSSIFYAYFSFFYLLLLYVVILFVYILSKYLSNSKDRIQLLFFALIVLILILFYFKFINLFLDNYTPLNEVILPLGISFYIFQCIMYLVDIYKKRIILPSFIDFFVYLIFFPHLISGPLIRPKSFFEQIKRGLSFKFIKIKQGVLFILWGLVLKICLADNLNDYVDNYIYHPLKYQPSTIFFSIIFFGFQLYADFAGYCLIAVGIFKLIGFNVVSNFNQPYNCSSFSDFWKRWNISLSNFFRDYLYIPLGGNRCSKFRNAFNILLVMFFAGIWHGSSILFIGWGLIHGCLLIIENLFIIKTINHKLLNFLRRIVTLFFIFLLWLPFKIIDPNIIESILKNSINYNSLNLFLIDGKLFFIKNILLILFIISIEFIFNKKNTYLLTKSNFYFFYIFMILFFIIITAKFNEQKFIYFQF